MLKSSARTWVRKADKDEFSGLRMNIESSSGEWRNEYERLVSIVSVRQRVLY